MKKLIQKSILNVTVAAVIVGGFQTAQAGDREWATAGKIITGVLTGGLLLRAFDPCPGPPPPPFRPRLYYEMPQPPVYVTPAQTTVAYQQPVVVETTPGETKTTTTEVRTTTVVTLPATVETKTTTVWVESPLPPCSPPVCMPPPPVRFGPPFAFHFGGPPPAPRHGMGPRRGGPWRGPEGPGPGPRGSRPF